jgi:N-acylneuraminate cytidylyltransferase
MPAKNMRLLGGRPLLAYSILTARVSQCMDRVVVTSDAQEILAAARSWGAEAIERPPDLASDTASTISAVQHALGVVESGGDSFAWVVVLQPNVPFRHVELCDRAIRDCVAREGDAALTVDEVYLKVGRSVNGNFVPDYPPGQRKQDIAPAYRENGVFYVASSSLVRKGCLFGDRTLILRFPNEQSLCNIDYEFDFKLAEAVFEPFGYKRRFDEHERTLFPDRSL